MTDEKNSTTEDQDDQPEPSFEQTSSFTPVPRRSEGWDPDAKSDQPVAAPWERAAGADTPHVAGDDGSVPAETSTPSPSTPPPTTPAAEAPPGGAQSGGAHARKEPESPNAASTSTPSGPSSGGPSPTGPNLDQPTENIVLPPGGLPGPAAGEHPDFLATSQFAPVQRPQAPQAQYGYPPQTGDAVPPWHQAGYDYQQPDGLAAAPPQPPAAPPTIDEVGLARDTRKPPTKGWRKLVYRMTGGSITPTESADEIALKALTERVQHPVNGDYRVAVLSLKGGVGKTTTTVGLGATFASLRGDRVIAVDANPDFGTLAQRGPQQTRSTVRDLLHDEAIHRYSDVRAYTSQAPSRLEIIASERDPAVSEAFSADDYTGVMKVLQRFYNIILTDCGTGLMHSAMKSVLDEANAIVLVSSPAIDAARSASATLDWLDLHGYGRLVQRAVVVLSSSRPGAPTVDVDQLTQHFLGRTRAVHRIPFDDHLAEGAEVDLDLLSPKTRRAFVELAATVADDFGVPHVLHETP
ncbi:MinD/ParA family protein [Tsukamurella sp. 8F]|uniref:MinD/ParA family ATP-binding protein n=1 Tax=unclassified Tsukamurella TaxID=2633480 RepID=UPI0023B974B2|nr:MULTISPECIES: MinD/ParA family protein [unclassified Tsukamurella]MDF0530896.1 MinD/ParA family protein [Tsukamurella sp. 8J]MDF0588159.1 MinD/ParA family protein [Tsukamurella sp. 8F]